MDNIQYESYSKRISSYSPSPKIDTFCLSSKLENVSIFGVNLWCQSVACQFSAVFSRFFGQKSRNFAKVSPKKNWNLEISRIFIKCVNLWLRTVFQRLFFHIFLWFQLVSIIKIMLRWNLIDNLILPRVYIFWKFIF